MIKITFVILYLFGGTIIRDVWLVLLGLAAILKVALMRLKGIYPHNIILIYFVMFYFLYGLFKDVLPNKSLPWLAFFFLIPFFGTLFRRQNEKKIHDSVIFLIKIVVTIIFSLHVIALIGYGRELLTVLKFLEVPGFFRERTYFGFAHYNLYFASTLFLAGISPILLREKKYWLLFFVGISIIIAPSRFGFVVFIASIVMLKIFKKDYIAKFCPLLIPIISFTYLILYLVIYLIYDGQLYFDPSSGLTSAEARVAHVLSIFDGFKISELFFGQAPGSEFFTLRHNRYVDNIEMTHLEIFRKFGLIGFVLLNAILVVVLRILNSKNLHSISISITLVYFMSGSNPIFLSSIMALLIGVSVSAKRKENIYV